MNKTHFSNVDEYIEAQPTEHQQLLKNVRKIMSTAVPQAEELIRWGAPFYGDNGLLGGFAAYKNHVRIGIVGTDLEPSIKESLKEKGYKVLERGFQINYDQSVPISELEQQLKAKADLNENRN